MGESVLTVFRRNALRLGTRICFHYKDKGTWQTLSWVDAEERVRRYALGLAGLGVKPGHKVAILAKTRLEWTLTDLAILAVQGVSVPIYSTLTPEHVAYIIKDADVSLLVVENNNQLERILPHLKDWKGTLLLMEGAADGILRLEDLAERGKGLAVNLYDENLKQIQPSDVATIIYTSGTTGTPKGSIITHRNILAELEGLQGVFQFGPEKIGMMCLPLAHVIARAMQFYQLAQGCQSAYCESLDRLPVNLREIGPHFMAGVPRLFEKTHDKIMAQVHQASGPVQKLFQWSLKIGAEVSMHLQRRLKIGLALKLKWGLAHLLIFRKIRKGLGGRIDCFISGGAPLRKEIAQFFHSVGILVAEGYGLTETFAAVALTRLDDFRFGTVGKPLDGIRIKIAKDGEICVKGDNVFSGYWHLKKETEESFDDEGWFLTGDIGEFTKDGFLRITDRKRDIIKTSGGKMVAPQAIESVMQQSRYIHQFMVYGEGKKFLSGLVTLNWGAVESFAKTNGIAFQDRQDLAENPRIFDLIQEEINQKNRNLSNFETIKKFVILPDDFSVESGELTPTLKIKRNLISAKYKPVLDQLYFEPSERGRV